MAYLDIKQHAIDRYRERVRDVASNGAIAMIRRDIEGGHPLRKARHQKWGLHASHKWGDDEATFIETADLDRLYVLVGACVLTVVTQKVVKGRLKAKAVSVDTDDEH